MEYEINAGDQYEIQGERYEVEKVFVAVCHYHPFGRVYVQFTSVEKPLHSYPARIEKVLRHAAYKRLGVQGSNQQTN